MFDEDVKGMFDPEIISMYDSDIFAGTVVPPPAFDIVKTSSFFGLLV